MESKRKGKERKVIILRKGKESNYFKERKGNQRKGIEKEKHGEGMQFVNMLFCKPSKKHIGKESQEKERKALYECGLKPGRASDMLYGHSSGGLLL